MERILIANENSRRREVSQNIIPKLDGTCERVLYSSSILRKIA